MKKHVFKRKVEFCDIDYGGVVYFANYLKYFDSARVDFFGSLGQSFQEQWKAQMLFVVRSIEVDYKKPLKLDNEFEILSTIESISAASVVLFQEMLLDKVIIATVKKKLAYVDFKKNKVIKISKDLRSCFTN